MQTEALNCPNCGGAVASDRTQCEFCRSRLKTVACASCLGLMFLGSKFCGHCGARAVSTEVLDDASPGECPRCKKDLESIAIGSTSVRECLKCGGFWLRPDAFETLCADKEQQSAVLGFIAGHPIAADERPPVNYIPCPDCKQLMNRSNFAKASGVIIDLCKQHGVWFDAEELPKIIEFIDKGGLARSREKEKIALQDERSRLRDEQLKLEMMQRRSGGSRQFDRDVDSGSGFGGIIGALFDL